MISSTHMSIRIVFLGAILLSCGSWDLTNRTVSDGVTSGVAGVPMSRCIRHGSPELGLDGRSSPAAAQRCAYSAGLDGPDKPRATLKPG